MTDLGSHELRHGGPDTEVRGHVAVRGSLVADGAQPGDVLIVALYGAQNNVVISGPVHLEEARDEVPAGRVRVLLRKATPGVVTAHVVVRPTPSDQHA